MKKIAKKIFNFLSKTLYNNCGLKNVSTREKWLKQKLINLPNDLKILDAGAGELKYKKYCEHLNYVSQDFGGYDGKGNSEGLQMEKWDNTKLDITCDIINIPEKDTSFDAIMCIEVLEHLEAPHLAIKEFSRLLKTNGKLILTAPFCSLTHFAPHYYANGFSKYYYEKVLAKYGFKIIEIKHNGNYFEYLAQEIHRIISIAKKHSKTNIVKNILLAFFSLPLLMILNSFSKKNKNSEDILCFGIQVLAKKL